MSNPTALVQKLWNYCNILRDDGLPYGDYVEPLALDCQKTPPSAKADEACGLAMAIVQPAPELGLPANATNGRQALRRLEWFDQLVRDALVMAAVLIIFIEDREGGPEVSFAQGNEPIQTFFLDRTNEAFGKGMALRHPRRAKHVPQCHAFAERFVRSIKGECLNRLVFPGEGPLRKTISIFIGHYRDRRNHQGIDNKLIEPPAARPEVGRIRCQKELGGMLTCYYREAA